MKNTAKKVIANKWNLLLKNTSKCFCPLSNFILMDNDKMSWAMSGSWICKEDKHQTTMQDLEYILVAYYIWAQVSSFHSPRL